MTDQIAHSFPWTIIIIGIIILFFNRHLIESIRTLLLPSVNRRENEFISILKPNDWMPPLISLIVLLSSLYVILSGNYDESHLKWAFGTIGMILGYWLKK